MKVILHFGMHKTGSTSIQRTLRKKKDPAFNYLPWEIFSHSNLFRLLFEDDDSIPLREKVAGITHENMAERREHWAARTARNIRKNPDKTVVFSAERGSSAPVAAHQKCRKFFRKFSDDIQVVIYVRSPASFIQSAYQQRLRNGGFDLNLDSLFPEYINIIRKLDSVYGEENVTIRVFDRDTLVGGDVVHDFCSVIGMEIEDDEIIRANESISAEAQALMFVQRFYGSGMSVGSPQAAVRNRNFLKSMMEIGDARLTFGPALIGPVIAANADKLAWIEERTGRNLSATGPSKGIVIDSQADLEALAIETATRLKDEGHPGFADADLSTPGTLAQALDLLQDNPVYEGAETAGDAE